MIMGNPIISLYGAQILFGTILALCMFTSNAEERIGLKIVGDSKSGYNVQILYDSKSIAQHSGGGEFSIIIENGDRSYHQVKKDWKAISYSGDSKHLELMGRLPMGNLNIYVDVKVIYEVINNHIIKKQIILSQNYSNKLYYSLENKLEPIETPSSYWSFDQEDCKGGSLLETYPAAGFRLKNGIAVGLLTDAGHRNLWTRNVRKRNIIAPFENSEFAAVQMMPDPDLFKVATLSERESGQNYVALNFGQVFNFTSGSSSIVRLSNIEQWNSLKEGQLEVLSNDVNNGPHFKVSGPGKKNTLSGISIPVKVEPKSFYTVSFKYKSDKPIATRLWDAKKNDVSMYINEMPADPLEWRDFNHQFYVVNINEFEDSYFIVISKSYYDSSDSYNIEVKDLRITKHNPVVECYHPLEMNKPSIKTMFVFAEPAKTIRDYRLASQIRLAEGLGFKGTEAEKILYADIKMLTWIAEPKDLTPHLVPSLNYSPDMYNRDSFWTSASCYDRQISEAVWNKWAATQDEQGCIGTIVTPYIGSTENTPNDATLCFILWAYVNKMRYNSVLNLEKVQKAIDYCRTTFRINKDGFYLATTPLCQNDVMWSDDEERIYAVNQGMIAVVLRCAKELGCNVTDEEIERAQKAYRACYDKKRGHIVHWQNRPEIITTSDFEPEFLSWWFWNEPILSSEAVINTLEKFPLYNGCIPIMCTDDGKYFSRENWPFAEDFNWENGFYMNGGSWLRAEYMAYVAGFKHNWKKAKQRMEQRLWAEFNLIPDEPVSHEWINTVNPSKTWAITRVFAWNAFVLTANEVAGLRKPEDDPDYGK